MDCRTTPAVRFRAKLILSQHDSIMIQEQLILPKIVTLFALVEISLLHNVLGYRIDAYFPKHKLAIEVDEQGHNDRDFNLEIEWQKAIEKNLVVNSLELIQLKRTFLLKLVKYRITWLCQYRK